MAIQNQPGMFSAGAVELDSSPSVNLYAQLAARKQAKEDAIDEYYRKLPSSLNSAGMRDQDRQGFDQAVGEWQKFWMENKDKIRKGNTKEAFDAEQKFRTIQSRVNDSKDRAKTDLELGKMRFSKENGYIFDDPDFMKSQQEHSLPIWDANHKGMDLGTVAVPPAPFDQEKQDKAWTSAAKGLVPGKQYDYSKKYTNPTTGQVIVPFKKTFSKDQVEKISDQMADLVKNDKSARRHYTAILNEPTSTKFDELQKAYSQYYKGIVDTPEKAAAAEAIIRATVPQEVGEEQEINYSQRQNDRVQTIILRDQLSDGNRGSGSGSGATTIQGNEFDRIEPSVGDVGGLLGGIKKVITGESETIIPDTDIPASVQAVLKTAGFDIGGFTKFKLKTKNGVNESITPIYDDGTQGKTIYRKDMDNAQLKYNSEPQKGGQPSFGNNKPSQQSSVPMYKKSSLLKAGWTEAQIKEATRKGKIKVN